MFELDMFIKITVNFKKVKLSFSELWLNYRHQLGLKLQIFQIRYFKKFKSENMQYAPKYYLFQD